METTTLEPHAIANHDREATQIDVSILIISYNTCEMTIKAIHSAIEETKNVRSEIIVVDNHSSDGSAEQIAERCPGVKLFALKENLGFAMANNYAAEYANGEYLLLLNPDTVVLNGALDKLVRLANEDGGNSIYGGRTVFADGSLNLMSCWKTPSLWSMFSIAIGLNELFPNSDFFNADYMPSWDRKGERNVDIVSGCLLLIRKELWDDLAGFDEQFRMYGEEFDLCLRARKRGVSCKVFGCVEIIHYGGASEKIRSEKLNRLLATKVLLVEKHWSPLRVWLAKRLLTLWPLHRRSAFLVAGLFRKRWREKSRVWSDVWTDRHAWLAGDLRLGN